jgi:hypothetical protein
MADLSMTVSMLGHHLTWQSQICNDFTSLCHQRNMSNHEDGDKNIASVLRPNVVGPFTCGHGLLSASICQDNNMIEHITCQANELPYHHKTYV